MLPWAHAAVGYLLYSAYSRWRAGRPPIGLTVYAVGLGTQFPDLIDKPLAWTFAVLPTGRSLGHSLIMLFVVLILLRVVSRHPDQRALSLAFGIGYVSHLGGDGIGAVIAGDFGAVSYLLWPLVAVPAGETRSFIAFFFALEPIPQIVAGLLLTVLGAAVWVYDGMPGVKDLLVEYHRDTEDPDPRPGK